MTAGGRWLADAMNLVRKVTAVCEREIFFAHYLDCLGELLQRD